MHGEGSRSVSNGGPRLLRTTACNYGKEGGLLLMEDLGQSFHHLQVTQIFNKLVTICAHT